MIREIIIRTLITLKGNSRGHRHIAIANVRSDVEYRGVELSFPSGCLPVPSSFTYQVGPRSRVFPIGSSWQDRTHNHTKSVGPTDRSFDSAHRTSVQTERLKPTRRFNPIC